MGVCRSAASWIPSDKRVLATLFSLLSATLRRCFASVDNLITCHLFLSFSVKKIVECQPKTFISYILKSGVLSRQRSWQHQMLSCWHLFENPRILRKWMRFFIVWRCIPIPLYTGIWLTLWLTAFMKHSGGVYSMARWIPLSATNSRGAWKNREREQNFWIFHVSRSDWMHSLPVSLWMWNSQFCIPQSSHYAQE